MDFQIDYIWKNQKCDIFQFCRPNSCSETKIKSNWKNFGHRRTKNDIFSHCINETSITCSIWDKSVIFRVDLNILKLISAEYNNFVWKIIHKISDFF